MKRSSILGLNTRTQLYAYRYNTKRGKNVANSKVITNRVMTKAGIAVPGLYARFKNQDQLHDYNWENLPSSFAVKPSRGLGGEGIIVVKNVSKDHDGWITTSRKKVTVDDLKMHISDILEGAYSMGNFPDVAIIQEYVGRHKSFRKYAYRGTPDIRIIIFNKVPVMAMLRLPTKESGGRANLHQGAIAVGVDIATGITTRGYWHGSFIKYKPTYSVEKFGPFGLLKKTRKDVTKHKLNGIKIPNWTTVLTTAVKAQEASGLGYCGVDIVLHPDKGAMVLELNAQPGLQIQMANLAGLKKRLERVEELEVLSADHGVRIARALFSERFTDRVNIEEGIKTVNVWELIKVVDVKKRMHPIPVKVDTGAWRTSIDVDFATSLGLVYPENIIAQKKVKNQMGKGMRRMINIVFYLAGRRIKTVASLAKRSDMRVKMIIGRRDLVEFLVKANETDVSNYEWYKSLWKKRK